MLLYVLLSKIKYFKYVIYNSVDCMIYVLYVQMPFS